MRARIPLVAWLLPLVAACGSDTSGPSSPDVETFVELMNAHRVSVGCAPLQWNEAVGVVAQAHSDDMVARSFFAHTNPDGDSPFDRLAAAGITYSAAAENIASGQSSASAVLNSWLNSAGHRANLENCNLTEHGVGLNDWRWTHLFIRP